MCFSLPETIAENQVLRYNVSKPSYLSSPAETSTSLNLNEMLLVPGHPIYVTLHHSQGYVKMHDFHGNPERIWE